MRYLVRTVYNYRLTRHVRPYLGRWQSLRLALRYASWGL